MKDPNTGKRVSKLNDEKDWIIQDVPELRILDEELWKQVKDRQGAINKHNKPLWAKQRPKNLFSGLIKCSCCGGGYSMVSQTHLGCSTARNKGTCNNRKTIKREKLEEDVLKALRTHLMDPKLSEMFCEEYTHHMNELRRNHNAALAGYQSEHKQVKKRLDQMVEAIADGAPVAPIKDKMHELENRRVALESMLTDIVVAPPMIHPSMAERYHAQVQTFIQALNAEETRSEAADVIRSLIEKIVLTPDESENRLVADLHGELAGILAISADRKSLSEVDETELARHKAFLGLEKSEESDAGSDQQDKLVAGAGFEPATFRL